MRQADVCVLHTRTRSVRVAGVVVRVEVRRVLELVDEVPARQPVPVTDLVVKSHDALIQILVDAGLKAKEARSRQAGRQEPVRESESDRVHAGHRNLVAWERATERVLQRRVAGGAHRHPRFGHLFPPNPGEPCKIGRCIGAFAAETSGLSTRLAFRL